MTRRLAVFDFDLSLANANSDEVLVERHGGKHNWDSVGALLDHTPNWANIMVLPLHDLPLTCDD